MGGALQDATWVVSCAHARYAGAVLAAAPLGASFVFLGSTRKFTRWPDAHAAGVIEGETAFLGAGRPGVMLHPTMIYGAEGENNVQRLAGLLRWLPVVPLPAGGRALVQPIYQDDITRCIRAVLARSRTGPESIVIAGPTPLPYRDFVQAVAQASGAGRRPVVSLPGPALMTLARTARLIPGLPRVETAELRRLMEDKAFDTGPMRQKLGVEPIPLAEGLARTFAAKQFARHADH
jgi:nucleoside-diphosphate-sugar epimerase